MNSAHQGMRSGVLGEHGAALHHLSSLRVGPYVPQARQTPGQPVSTSEDPRDVLAAFPVRLKECQRRDAQFLADTHPERVSSLCQCSADNSRTPARRVARAAPELTVGAGTSFGDPESYDPTSPIMQLLEPVCQSRIEGAPVRSR